jgi:hypothetical protein
MTSLANANLFNQFLSSSFNTKKEKKSELLDLDIAVLVDGRITTVAAVARFLAPKKEEIVSFYDHYVRVGNRMYPIMIEETGDLTFLFGIPVTTNVKKAPYIVKNGKRLNIKEDFQGNKFLQE